MDNRFKLVSSFKPAGDQPAAIENLTVAITEGRKEQVLLGVTGSGKTFTIANLIEKVQKPTLIISPNKILAAQLYAEFKSFFPENAVEYFISYYDYYQPEAYIPQTDTYIEKDSSINDHIDRLRLKATTSLLERKDVIIVASVSCIYNLGSPEEYRQMCVFLKKGEAKSRQDILTALVNIHYQRNDIEFGRGTFRVRGDTLEIYPAYLETALRVELFGDEIERISEIHPVTGAVISGKERVYVYPARHFVTPRPQLEMAIKSIEDELARRLIELKQEGKLLEHQRLEQRTHYDIEMIRETGFCHGIENYSRLISGRPAGSRPACLIDYFRTADSGDFLTVIDESHITVPQIRGMYEGDRSRKQTLVDFGFRLPSALDNRPLKFHEFEAITKQIIYVSATPAAYELTKTHGEVTELIIRPTGLIDPEVIIRPIEHQIDDLIREINYCVKHKQRVLVTTLTKRMSEDLTDYLKEKGLLVQYLHSEIDALARVDILKNLRLGKFDVLVGINLLREGLDLPEVGLVAVLDADKEGFLRSETTLIQVCGRAARNVEGKVILYADNMTGSMSRALGEMNRRRIKQEEYNRANNITPRSIVKAVHDLEEFQYKAKEEGLANLISESAGEYVTPANFNKIVAELEKQMRQAADNLDFELAARLRDKIFALNEMNAKRKGRGK
ncbi:MAG: excinuclease ABC subunit B [Elusimicrobia bacterium RIFOXYA2_FULL_50_26]|nr:MAG: excinuclease ABC subunit B [Elusimicrobia bacterium RIFOXYA2_FULL_50_26]